MEYIFILGRNPILSYAEVISYFKSHDMNYEITSFNQNYLLISTPSEINFSIQDLGGVIKIGKASEIKSQKNLKDQIENYFAVKEKFNYSVIGNDEEKIEEIELLLKNKFKKEKLKAQVRHKIDKINMQEGEKFELINADVEFFFYKTDLKNYFGLIEQNYSYKEVKERDMQKPIRREELAISPRLAKILINLSQTKKNEMLVDPFCGIGVILQEAVLKGINCFGVDKDKFAIEGARKNMEWLSSKFKFTGHAKFFIGNSAKMPPIKIGGVATEPALGTLVKKKIFDSAAGNYIKEFETLIIPVLKKIKNLKTPNAKIVLTMPFIRKYSVSVYRITTATGLRVYEPDEKIKMPIRESREKQFVGREILILE